MSRGKIYNSNPEDNCLYNETLNKYVQYIDENNNITYTDDILNSKHMNYTKAYKLKLQFKELKIKSYII